MVENEKHMIEGILSKNGFVEIEETSIQDLINVFQKGTLGNIVATALIQRKQGHFDKAMLKISEANRDQVLSIRKIQTIIDEIKGVSKTEIVFEKYRQYYPFRIGLTNGKDVLEFLRLIKLACDFAFEEVVADLHENEEMIDPMLQELNFYETRMKGQISEDEINALKNNIEKIHQRIFEMKFSLMDCICRVVQEYYSQISNMSKIALVKNAYSILSSSIQTRDTKFIRDGTVSD